MKYDILILCAQKDYNKIKFLINSIKQFLTDNYNDIYIVSPTMINDKIDGVKYFLDQDVLDIDRNNFKYRPNWVYQQFVKLLQNITSDLYLVLDSDVLLNSNISLFENGKKCFMLGGDQNQDFYYSYTQELLGIGREYNHSFISEMLLFDRNIINNMMLKIGGKNKFIEKSFDIICEDIRISEYEMYGNFTMKYYPEEYNIKKLKTLSIGKREPWTDNQINNHINMYKHSDYNVLTIHSWIVEQPYNKI